MNLFRCTPDRSLDKEFLRTCAVHKLLDRGCINMERAIELLTIPKSLRRGVVEDWKLVAGQKTEHATKAPLTAQDGKPQGGGL